MRHALDENAKRRLTDRAQIEVAVEFLLARGIVAEEIALQLSRRYYIDIDMLNEVLAEDQVLATPLPSAETAWREVA